MSIKEFCKEFAGKFVEKSDELASDFEWLVECAEMNAEYGYYPSYLIDHNATARELLSSDERFKDAIIICGKIGWYKCAEDDALVQQTMREALA